MKSTTIAFAAIGVFNLGMAGLKYAANKHAKARAAAQAVENHSDEVKAVLETAKKRCDIFKEMTAKEKKEFEKQVREWKIANGFDEKKLDIINGVNSGLDEFKESIGYFDKIEELDDNFDAAIEAFKTSIDYDANKQKLEGIIEEAKAHYERQKVAFELAGDDISDTTMKLRHAEEEAMNAKVKEAKGQIDILEKQLKEETEKLTQKKLEGVRTLEEKVSKEKIRLDKKSNKDLEKLNNDLTSAQDDIQKKIRKARSNDEKTAVANHESDIHTIHEQKELDAKAANDIYNNMGMDCKFAKYLKDKKVPKMVVGIVGFLPLIPVAYLLSKYVGFVGSVIKAM